MLAYWLMILNQLLWGFHHLAFGHGLYFFYVSHHAVGFLHSGITSGSGDLHYVFWLAQHHISPRDW